MSSIQAILFDVIGTLVDEDAAWTDAAARLSGSTDPAEGEALRAQWAQLLDERMRAVVRGDSPWRPHRELVAESALEAANAAGGPLPPDALQSIADIDDRMSAWPDVAEGTAALRRRHLVAGLSNGDLSSLARLANSNAISWDTALSTSAVRTFKPDPAAYSYAIDELRLDPQRTLFTAAHPWDLRAAALHGFRTAFIGRPGAERPSADDRFDFEVSDLHGLVQLLM